MTTSTLPTPNVELQFRTLVNEWRTATRYFSSLAEAVQHPSYREIVSLGSGIIPFLLAELAKSPEPWFAALRELTGEDPVSVNERGRPQLSADAWLAWGRSRGLI